MAWIYTRKLTGFPNFPFPFFPTEYMFPFFPFPFYPKPLASSSLLHSMLPDRRDNDITSSLRNAKPFYSFRTRTNRLRKLFLPYCLDNYNNSQWFCNVSINFQAQLRMYFYVLPLIFCILHDCVPYVNLLLIQLNDCQYIINVIWNVTWYSYSIVPGQCYSHINCIITEIHIKPLWS